MAMVRLPRALLKNWLFTIHFCRGEGNPTSVFGSQPIIWLLSLSPSDVRRPEVTQVRTSGLLCDPHSFLTVTFWLLDTLIQYGRIVSVLPLRLRELSRDSRHTGVPVEHLVLFSYVFKDESSNQSGSDTIFCVEHLLEPLHFGYWWTQIHPFLNPFLLLVCVYVCVGGVLVV